LKEKSCGKKRKTSELSGITNPSDKQPKKRKMRQDLTFCFPSRATRRKWLRHGTLLNLRYVANKILKKQDKEVVTWGFDDTKKAAGVHLLDVKTSNITIDGDDRKRETYTTGFTPNLSHSGLDQAATLKHSLQMLAVLAGGRYVSRRPDGTN
jgi:hypothetical protein